MPRPKLYSSGRALASNLEQELSVPQVLMLLQEYSDRLETNTEATISTMVKSLMMSEASFTPLKTQWRKNCKQ